MSKSDQVAMAGRTANQIHTKWNRLRSALLKRLRDSNDEVSQEGDDQESKGQEENEDGRDQSFEGTVGKSEEV